MLLIDTERSKLISRAERYLTKDSVQGKVGATVEALALCAIAGVTQLALRFIHTNDIFLIRSANVISDFCKLILRIGHALHPILRSCTVVLADEALPLSIDVP